MSNKLFFSLIIYGGSSGVARILPLLVLPFLLRKLGADEFGRIEIIFAFFNLAIIFGIAQLESSFQRFFFKSKNIGDLYFTIVTLIILLSIIVISVIMFFSSKISTLLFGSLIEIKSICITAITIFFVNISTINLIYLRFLDCKLKFAVSNITQVVVSVFVGYILIVNYDLGSLGYFIGILIGWIFCFIITCFYLAGNIKAHARYKLYNVSNILSFSMPQFPARIASFIFQYGNRFIILSALGSLAVAKVSLAIKFAAPFQFLMLALSMVWNPFLYKSEGSDDLNNKLNIYINYLIVTIILIHVIVVIGSRYIVANFLDSELAEIAGYVPLAIIPFELLVLKEIIESGIKLSNKTKYITYSYLISSIIMVSTMLISKNIFYMLNALILGTYSMIILTWYYSTITSSLKLSMKAFCVYSIFILANIYYCYLIIE